MRISINVEENERLKAKANESDLLISKLKKSQKETRSIAVQLISDGN